MLALFSRTFGEAEMQKSQEMADSQADLAGAIATQAKAFVAAHRDVSDPTPENLDKAVNDFEKALVAVRSMRAEVERELEGVESQRGELR
jgi:L-fucose isomerase-like protein